MLESALVGSLSCILNMGKAQQYSFSSREEALAQGVLWTYGYASDPEFQYHIGQQLQGDLQQYDLEMFFFLNYVPNEKRGHKGFPTNIPRDEHWWRAAERRWPSRQDREGRLIGEFERDEWSEAIIRAISKRDTVNVAGAAGGGKTTIFVAFGLTIWDYFAHTWAGCRFQFSSITEEKLKKACWAATDKLYRRSNLECSSSIGQGELVPGEMMIRRRKGLGLGLQGIVKGVTISNDSNAASRIDTLTGTHDPHCQILFTDEAQSSPDALHEAGSNLRMHAHWFWEFRSGNLNDPTDYLGKSAEPMDGWGSIDPSIDPDAPREWESNYKGTRAICIRLDNDFSPGIKDPVKYHYRPNKTVLETKFPTAISRQAPGYWRFWKGWFTPSGIDESVIRYALIEQMGCHAFAKINPNHPIINFMTFDSAPTSMDRSPLGHMQLLYEGNKRVLNISQVFPFPKLNADTYDRDCTTLIMDKAVEWQVPSGNLIVDYTNYSGPMSLLKERGFHCHGIQYQSSATDKPVDPQAGAKPSKEVYADLITEAAFLLEAYIRYGQIRGLNESTIGGAGVEKEICSRRTQNAPQSGKVKLEQKANRNGKMGFRDRLGFSPDIFDILCQAALFARDHLNFWPGEVDKAPQIKQNKSSATMRGGWNRRFR